MNFCVDVGGTKTLFSVVATNGKIAWSEKIPTPNSYHQLIELITSKIKNHASGNLVAIAAPGRIDRATGSVIAYGNLNWANNHYADDIRRLTGHTVILENDANAAALGEAKCLEGVHKVLYVTISTGIGSGLVVDGYLEPNMLDAEVGQMLFNYQGELKVWESFASGKAMVQEFGMQASEIQDVKIWQEMSRRYALGFYELITNYTPDQIVIGGGVGSHFEKFGDFLVSELERMRDSNKLISIPLITQAKNPEGAVIQGCDILIRQYAKSE